MKKDVVVPVIIASLVFAGVGFFGGMKYSQVQRGNFRNGQFGNGNFMMQGGRTGGANGQGGGRMMQQGFRPTIGEIIASDDEQSSSSTKSITVKMQDGSSKIVLISDTTMINKSDAGSKADLTVGTKVGVFGVDNNGTVTAQSIQINPQQSRMINGSPSASPK